MMHTIKHSLSKAFHHGHHHDHSGHHHDHQNDVHIQQKTVSTPHPPTPLDILRYRYQYGANLGSVYILEKWLFNSAFPSSCADEQTSELEAVTAWTGKIGINATRDKFEARWRKIIGILDWNWMVDKAYVTSIRLPIGYFTLGPDYCHGTPFEPYAAVYTNAWSSVKSFIATARSYGIGVLIDFHALPGGANAGDHSGTNSGVAALWTNSSNLNLSQRSLEFIAKEIATGSVVDAIGLQLCNEAEYNAPGMYNWYSTVVAAISTIDPSIPLYISDGWDLPTAIKYALTQNKATTPSAPVCIDTHLYFCFEDDDKSPQQIIALIPDQLSELNDQTGSVTDCGACQLIVGEYACTLSEATWARAGDSHNCADLKSQFGKAQCQRWNEVAGGSYFWTLRMDWMDGGDWGFVEQTNLGALSPPSSLLLSKGSVTAICSRASQQQVQLGNSSYGQHVSYWNQASPNGKFDHDLYRQGWILGWDDALAFFSARSSGALQGSNGGDKIGMLELWVRKRILDSGVCGSFVWEFEGGLRKGVADFYACAGV